MFVRECEMRRELRGRDDCDGSKVSRIRDFSLIVRFASIFFFFFFFLIKKLFNFTGTVYLLAKYLLLIYTL